MSTNPTRAQWDQVIDKYFSELDPLPSNLKQNYNQIRELDKKSQDLLGTIDQESEEFFNEIMNYTPEERAEKRKRIQKWYNKSKAYSDEKLRIAIQTYEMVDKHIRRLDSDMMSFESDLKSNKNKKSEATVNKSKKRGVDGHQGKRKNRNNDVDGGKKRKRKKEVESSIASVIPSLAAIANPGEAIDMPVDPNEPTYCLCQQVSYGEMIACDKMECPIEWFHFACVSLTTKPKGKWYCPRCTTEKKKK